MAHNIFGERFYGHREKAWHNLGLVTYEDMQAIDVLNALGGGYWVEKRPVTIELNGEQVSLGDYGLVRSALPDDPREVNFGFVKENYNIIQPLRIAEIFDEKVQQPVETMGMLGRGEKLFLTWKLPAIDVKGDVIETYAFIAVGYDGKFGLSLMLVSVRVVCENTFSMALSEAENTKDKGRGKVWSGRHNSDNIENEFGIWIGYAQENAERESARTKAALTVMANKEMQDKNEITTLLFDKIYPVNMNMPEYYPDELRAKKLDQIEKKIEWTENSVDSIMRLYNGEGTSIDASAYGLFNAITEYENYGRTVRKDPSVSILMGGRSQVMNRAYSVLSEYAMAEVA